MPSALVTALSAPLRLLRADLGTGSPGAAAALSGIGVALADLAVATGGSWQGTRWEGAGGDAAADFTRSTVAALDDLAARAGHLDAVAADAGAAVARARVRLQAIIDEFEARAAALEGDADEPGVADELAAAAQGALAEAEAVVDELRAELDGHRAAVAAPTGAAPPTTPMGTMPGLGGLLGSGPGAGSGASQPAGFSAWSDTRAESPMAAADAVRPSADPATFGSGVDVQLPDGSTATAPNAVAAGAVRYALTQLGVPYHWGGTAPGVGLDCSGLTQWAYREAGLDIPRLAQDQDIGAAVGRDSLRPGDLAVWDGHVAMMVGNGLMIEAGDPVKLSPVRTTNAGQGFQGFWRPTA